jgi:hypothetical protein
MARRRDGESLVGLRRMLVFACCCSCRIPPRPLSPPAIHPVLIVRGVVRASIGFKRLQLHIKECELCIQMLG